MHTIKITAAEEDKFVFKNSEVLEELMKLGNKLFECGISLGLNLLICYTSQFGAKLGNFFRQSGLHKSMELLYYFLSFTVDDDHRTEHYSKPYKFWQIPLIFRVIAFEVIDANIFYFALKEILSI